MKRALRTICDWLFTGLSGLSVLLMTAALVIILGPILWRGAGAVLFHGTVEWREAQLREPIFNRGDEEEIEAELARARAAREPVYDILDRFGTVLDPQGNAARASRIYYDYRRQLREDYEAGELSDRQYGRLNRGARTLSRALRQAYEATENEAALEALSVVLEFPDKEVYAGTDIARLFELAEQYREALTGYDLSRRAEDVADFADIQEGIYELFGPRPGREPRAPLAEAKYGAPRMDMARRSLDDVLYRTRHVEKAGEDWNVPERVPRRQLYAGTIMERAFILLEENIDEMLLPRWTFYWQWFIDDSTPSHYFGGVWPEIFGTLVVTVLCMAFTVPVGIVAAVYLVECAGQNIFVRAIRMCINTLAGVPSIVFGLFGLAFFLGWLPELWDRIAPAGRVGTIVLILLGGGAFVVFFLLRTVAAGQPIYRRVASLAAAGGIGYLTVTQVVHLATNPVSLSTGANVLAGALTLSVLVLPIIIRASEEAIRSVPLTYKEAALSLGAGPVRTFANVTLPAALPGVLTGIILGMSRAAGETAPILFVAAVAWREGLPESLVEGATRTLSYSSYVMASGDEIAVKVPHNQYGMIATLVALVLMLNVAAILIRSHVARKLRGQ
jgi:ABC-type phosphate transport system permease subunit